jgi:hypothetical protein
MQKIPEINSSFTYKLLTKKAFNKKTNHTLQNTINVKYSAYLLKNVFAWINLFQALHNSPTHTCTLTSSPTVIINFLTNYLDSRNVF